jgi:hypothetical protein
MGHPVEGLVDLEVGERAFATLSASTLLAREPRLSPNRHPWSGTNRYVCAPQYLSFSTTMSQKASFPILVPSACHRQLRQLLPRTKFPTQKNAIMGALVQGEHETEEEQISEFHQPRSGCTADISHAVGYCFRRFAGRDSTLKHVVSDVPDGGGEGVGYGDAIGSGETRCRRRM